MWEQVLGALKKVERQTGKRFGDPKNPLLVSCRSGAKFSMPGMMDTVLNIGLNDDVAAGLGRAHRRRALRLRRLPAPGADVRHGRAGRRPTSRSRKCWQRRKQARRRQRRRPAAAELCKRSPASSSDRVKKHGKRDSRATRSSSCSWRSRPCSTPGTASARSTTATPPASRTTSAPPSTSSPWCSATWATAPAPASPPRATSPPARSEIEGDYLTNAQGEDVVAGIARDQAHRRR